MVLLVPRPEKYREPEAVAMAFHGGSPVLPVDVLELSSLIKPPPLKKYLAALAEPKVTVLVTVIVHEAPDLPAVLEFVPVQAVYLVPCATALAALVVQLEISALTLANTEISVPAVGAALVVMVVPVWLPQELSVLTSDAHCVAVTVFPAETVPSAVWP